MTQIVYSVPQIITGPLAWLAAYQTTKKQREGEENVMQYQHDQQQMNQIAQGVGQAVTIPLQSMYDNKIYERNLAGRKGLMADQQANALTRMATQNSYQQYGMNPGDLHNFGGGLKEQLGPEEWQKWADKTGVSEDDSTFNSRIGGAYIQGQRQKAQLDQFTNKNWSREAGFTQDDYARIGAERWGHLSPEAQKAYATSSGWNTSDPDFSSYYGRWSMRNQQQQEGMARAQQGQAQQAQEQQKYAGIRREMDQGNYDSIPKEEQPYFRARKKALRDLADMEGLSGADKQQLSARYEGEMAQRVRTLGIQLKPKQQFAQRLDQIGPNNPARPGSTFIDPGGRGLTHFSAKTGEPKHVDFSDSSADATADAIGGQLSRDQLGRPTAPGRGPQGTTPPPGAPGSEWQEWGPFPGVFKSVKDGTVMTKDKDGQPKVLQGGDKPDALVEEPAFDKELFSDIMKDVAGMKYDAEENPITEEQKWQIAIGRYDKTQAKKKEEEAARMAERKAEQRARIAGVRGKVQQAQAQRAQEILDQQKNQPSNYQQALNAAMKETMPQTPGQSPSPEAGKKVLRQLLRARKIDNNQYVKANLEINLAAAKNHIRSAYEQSPPAVRLQQARKVAARAVKERLITKEQSAELVGELVDIHDKEMSAYEALEKAQRG